MVLRHIAGKTVVVHDGPGGVYLDYKNGVICPSCGAHLLSYGGAPLNFSAEWNAENRSYEAALTIPGPIARDKLDRLPQMIAETSACSCGHALSVGSHSIERTDERIEFRGTFICPVCATAKDGTQDASRLKRAVLAVWKQIESVTVGSDGAKVKVKGGYKDPEPQTPTVCPRCAR
jgi:hypothetical protein